MPRIAFSSVATHDWPLDRVLAYADRLEVDGVELRTFGSASPRFACDPALTSEGKIRRLSGGDGVIVFASMGGFGRPAQSNIANVFLRLAPWKERTVKQQDITAEVFPQVTQIPGVRAFAVNPGSLGQRGFQAPVQLVLQGPDYDTLVVWRDLVMERLRQSLDQRSSKAASPRTRRSTPTRKQGATRKRARRAA